VRGARGYAVPGLSWHCGGVEIDIAVVGGGIAGVSVAAELAEAGGARVALLEGEPQLAYHASGRSAATFLESYGSREIRALTKASRPAFDTGDQPLLTPRKFVWVAPAHQVPLLRTLLDAEPVLRETGEAEVRELCPAVRPGYVALAAVEDAAADLDVAGLFELYRRRAVAAGASVHMGMSILDGQWEDGRWRLRTTTGADVSAGIVVNAAGAWADDLARRCGVAPVGLVPYRRTVALVTSEQVRRDWPLIGDIGETFYFRPEGDGLLLSPADQTPTDPVDAKPEMEDVAMALDRANEATTLNLRHVRTSWAGLRTFAPDRNPVLGFDAVAPGFFWLAGQGGYGMQTAPAMAALAAAQLLERALPQALAEESIDPSALAPGRFTA
jgi:D-arginine dehydrogenase